MRHSDGRARGIFVFVFLAVFLSLSLAPPAAAAAPLSSGVKRTFCNWSFANSGTAPADGKPRPAIVDLYAGYWELYISAGFPAGTRFVIRGQYPAARYFSLQVTTDSVKNLQTIAALPDYRIVPDAGSRSPYTAINTVDPSIAPGGAYTAYLVFSPPPAQPEPNTLYVDPALITGVGGTISLSYRIYGGFAGVSVADHGGVPMPQLSLLTDGGEEPMSSLLTPLLCLPLVAALDATVQFPIDALKTALSLPLHIWPVPPLPVPAAPQFLLRDPDSTTDEAVNRDARYIYSNELSQNLGDLVFVRMRAPSYATGPGAGNDPQLRYWSLCQGSAVQTYACLRDSAVTVDADGFVDLIVSIPAKKPAGATAQSGYNWLPFGPSQPGVLIYRQLQPAPDFAQSAFDVPAGADPAATMGDYFPQATYCGGGVFAAHLAAGETPAQVFAGCQSGR